MIEQIDFSKMQDKKFKVVYWFDSLDVSLWAFQTCAEPPEWFFSDDDERMHQYIGDPILLRQDEEPMYIRRNAQGWEAYAPAEISGWDVWGIACCSWERAASYFPRNYILQNADDEGFANMAVVVFSGFDPELLKEA